MKEIFAVFLRVQSLLPRFSISFCVTYFTFWMSQQRKKKRFRNRRNGALFRISFQLFDFSYVNINSGKNHILFSANNAVRVYIDNNAIPSENKNELLGIDLDSNLTYEKQPL